MLRKQAIIYLLLVGFLTPTGIALTARFMDSYGEGKLLIGILSGTEEESSEEQKTEKEKEKQLSCSEFSQSILSPDKSTPFESSFIFHLLQGDFDFPTPPPKFS